MVLIIIFSRFWLLFMVKKLLLSAKDLTSFISQNYTAKKEEEKEGKKREKGGKKNQINSKIK